MLLNTASDYMGLHWAASALGLHPTEFNSEAGMAMHSGATMAEKLGVKKYGECGSASV